MLICQKYDNDEMLFRSVALWAFDPGPTHGSALAPGFGRGTLASVPPGLGGCGHACPDEPQPAWGTSSPSAADPGAPTTGECAKI